MRSPRDHLLSILSSNHDQENDQENGHENDHERGHEKGHEKGHDYGHDSGQEFGRKFGHDDFGKISVFNLLFLAVASATLISCSVYQSEGRKSFETKVLRSNNVTLSNVTLQECHKVESLEAVNESENALPAEALIYKSSAHEIFYNHPHLQIRSLQAPREQENSSQEDATSAAQSCSYFVDREQLSSRDLEQIIKDIDHEP